MRAPGDPRIQNTLRAIDTLLEVETPCGPIWHRYNGDRYGEHQDGAAFDGTGIGRAWPLLTGERAHYEIAALQARQRYLVEHRRSPHAFWRFNDKLRTIAEGRQLRVETLAPAMIHWSSDGCRTTNDTQSRDTGMGVHVTDLPTEALPIGARILFTLYWPEANRWEGRDYSVVVTSPE